MDRYELPEGWEWRTLGQVANITAGTTAPQNEAYFSGGQFPFVRTQDVGRCGRTTNLTETTDRVTKIAVQEKRLKFARKGAILFPKSGASILTNSRAKLGVDAYIVSHLAIVEAKKSVVDDSWLYYWLCTIDMAMLAQSESGYPSLRLSDVQKIQIPIPALSEQNRLVSRIEALAQRIEASRKEQQEAISMASAYFNLLCQRTYRELLETCITISLRESGNIMGGGTPSKDNAAFWKGDIPWIAPKEMKRWHIGESSLTITETAINQSAAHLIPAPAVLFVVRGMILARIVPVAISTCSLTVNQDMKAIVPRQKLSAEFLAYMLLGAQPELLSMVEVAGHGTRKLESDRWGSLPIPLLDSSKQTLIVQRLETMRRKADELTAVQRAAESDLAALMPAILAKAFRGEL